MDEGFPIPAWDAEQHIAFMDKAGIQTAVLTMPAPQPWFGDAEASATVCRSYNEECAALKARYPGRFMFCAALPLPDVPHALEEARYALEVLGADGIKLATNSYGQYLGEPALDTLMAYLDQQNAVVILHPHKPSAVNAQLVADVPLASYEYLAETTRTVLNMVAHDVLVGSPQCVGALSASESRGAALRFIPAQCFAPFPLPPARDGETRHDATCGC